MNTEHTPAVTPDQIRARLRCAAKLSEIFGNKKPGIAPGILNFECSRQALPGPGCELFTHHRPVHEQCIFLK